MEYHGRHFPLNWDQVADEGDRFTHSTCWASPNVEPSQGQVLFDSPGFASSEGFSTEEFRTGSICWRQPTEEHLLFTQPSYRPSPIFDFPQPQSMLNSPCSDPFGRFPAGQFPMDSRSPDPLANGLNPFIQRPYIASPKIDLSQLQILRDSPDVGSLAAISTEVTPSMRNEVISIRSCSPLCWVDQPAQNVLQMAINSDYPSQMDSPYEPSSELLSFSRGYEAPDQGVGEGFSAAHIQTASQAHTGMCHRRPA